MGTQKTNLYGEILFRGPTERLRFSFRLSELTKKGRPANWCLSFWLLFKPAERGTNSEKRGNPHGHNILRLGVKWKPNGVVAVDTYARSLAFRGCKRKSSVSNNKPTCSNYSEIWCERETKWKDTPSDSRYHYGRSPREPLFINQKENGSQG